MQNWDAEKYLNSVSAPNISLEEERRLFAIIKGEGSTDSQKQDAIDSICRSHIRFVSQMADYYCKRCPVDMEDMIGAGVIGMLSAIDKFNLEYNVKFTTYAGHWIKLEMIRHIQDSCPVVVPQSVHDGLIKVKTAIREADGDLSREELKEKLGFNEDKMQKLEKAKIQTVSLQKEQNTGGETSFLEDIISDGGDTPYDSIEREDLLRCLREILEELDEKTLEIVMSKHAETKVRLQDLADKYGVSPERIRQIREDATSKLRAKLLAKTRVKSDYPT